MLASVRHGVEERDLVPAAEAADPTRCANARGAVPGHPGMPEARQLHDLRAALGGVTLHGLKHGEHMRLARPTILRSGRGKAILGGRAQHQPFAAEAWRERPYASLEHELRDVP